MNLVPAVLRGRDARASGFSVELPRELGVERVVLGIRPESLSERLPAPDGVPLIEVTARQVEMVGPHQLVHGTAGDDVIVARVERRFVVFRGDRVRLSANPASVHVFDAATGRALL